jgi:hypothetical protein
VQTVDVLAYAVRRADSVRSTKKPAGDYLLEQDAEDELRAVLSDDTPRAMFYKQEGGVDRIYDAYDEATDTLIEVKHGWTTYNGRARDQLTKDLARLQSGEIDRIEWAFFPNANGTFGPDKALLAAITNAQDRGLNISITLWVPTA